VRSCTTCGVALQREHIVMHVRCSFDGSEPGLSRRRCSLLQQHEAGVMAVLAGTCRDAHQGTIPRRTRGIRGRAPAPCDLRSVIDVLHGWRLKSYPAFLFIIASLWRADAHTSLVAMLKPTPPVVCQGDSALVLHPQLCYRCYRAHASQTRALHRTCVMTSNSAGNYGLWH
jgi:hypothetical protein